MDRDRQRDRVAGGLRLDTIALEIGRLTDSITGLEAQAREPVERARATVKSRVGDGIEGREAAETLDAYLTELEREIEGVAQAHSRHFWMQLTRRIPPGLDEADWKEWSTTLIQMTIGNLTDGIARQ